jgi:hypothetical protein
MVAIVSANSGECKQEIGAVNSDAGSDNCFADGRRDCVHRQRRGCVTFGKCSFHRGNNAGMMTGFVVLLQAALLRAVRYNMGGSAWRAFECSEGG